MEKEIKGENYYWALLCYCTEGDPLICGVYPSFKEAKEVGKEVKECPALHKIKRCKIKITLCQNKK